MFRRTYTILLAGGALFIAAAPAQASQATCDLDGPVSVKHRDHGTFPHRDTVTIESKGTARCTGQIGDGWSAGQPGGYVLSGRLDVVERCSAVTRGLLRLDVSVPKAFAIGYPAILDATADLRPAGLSSASVVSGIGSAAGSGLDLAGSLVESTISCTGGQMRMHLVLRDGPNQPFRPTEAAPAPEQTQAAPAAAKKVKKISRCMKRANRKRGAARRRAIRACKRAERRAIRR